MRVLFDNNVPRRLRRYLVGHSAVTAAEMDWTRLVNGQLLGAAEEAGFEVMLTADQSIVYQQNLKGRKLALVVMDTNDWGKIRLNIAPVAEAISRARPGSYETLALGRT